MLQMLEHSVVKNLEPREPQGIDEIMGVQQYDSRPPAVCFFGQR